MDFYQIDFIKSIYISELYNVIIPKLKNYFKNYKYKDLVFNFGSLEFISPNVIPHIFNIADIYSNFCSKKLKIIISWENLELLKYLDAIGFFILADKSKFIDYNREMVGGFESYKTKNNCKFMIFDRGLDEDSIKDQIPEMLKVLNVVQMFDSDTVLNERDIGEILFHLIDNSTNINQGDSNAYVAFQVNKYDKKHFAYLSICDNGNGIKSTIEKQFKAGIYSPCLTQKSRSTFSYILEAIFWRRLYPEKHGIYQIADLVFKRNGRLSIHSNDTIATFNNKNFLAYFDTITKSIDEKKYERIRSIKLEELEIQLSTTRKYKGVHIDLEFPLGEVR